MGLVRERNAQAFNELYHRYHRRVFYYFYRMLGGVDEKAQDFLQDIFMKLVEKPEYFDTSKRFSTWLFSIAHNMCKNEYRKLAVRKVIDNEASVDVAQQNETDSATRTDLNLFTDQLFRELDQLSEEQKTAFLLRYREGFSIKEISQVLDCSEGTVKSRVFYTNKKLALKLEAFNPINNY